MPWFTSSCGCVELRIKRADAASATHPGPCDMDVRDLSAKPYVAKQLEAVDPDDLRKELREYGAWDSEELADHKQNLQRILWIACGDIHDRH